LDQPFGSPISRGLHDSPSFNDSCQYFVNIKLGEDRSDRPLDHLGPPPFGTQFLVEGMVHNFQCLCQENILFNEKKRGGLERGLFEQGEGGRGGLVGPHPGVRPLRNGGQQGRVLNPPPPGGPKLPAAGPQADRTLILLRSISPRPAWWALTT